MANIQEMAEAHLRNVQQQIQDLQGQKEQIDKDIQMLSDYLQQGVAELESVTEAPEMPEAPMSVNPTMLNLGE